MAVQAAVCQGRSGECGVIGEARTAVWAGRAWLGCEVVMQEPCPPRPANRTSTCHVSLKSQRVAALRPALAGILAGATRYKYLLTGTRQRLLLTPRRDSGDLLLRRWVRAGHRLQYGVRLSLPCEEYEGSM